MWGKQLLKCEQLKAQLDPSFGGSSLCLRQRISLNCNMIFFFSVGCKRKGCLALFAGKKLGFCFHGDLEFSVLWGCKLLLCFYQHVPKERRAGNGVTFLGKALEFQQGCLDGAFGTFNLSKSTLRLVLLQHRSDHCISDNSLTRTTWWSGFIICRLRIKKMMGRDRNGWEETQGMEFLQAGRRKCWEDTFRWQKGCMRKGERFLC